MAVTNDDLVRVAPGLKYLLVAGASALALSMTPAMAQDDASDDDIDLIEESEEEILESADIVVTGSRVRRDTFTSISPLQVISGDVSREVGLIDPATILQESTAANGQQIDLSFQGFVLDNGPGASTVSLRGLGANRTLVLINGRRVSPAGVEGAPSVPDLNLLPSSLVEQFEIVLDGASPVYGSDAIAGVVNAVLRKDFDGFELEYFGNRPIHDGGTSNTIAATWGKNWDRGFIGVGVEYVDQDSAELADRPWTAGCAQDLEITESGEIRTTSIGDNIVRGMDVENCQRTGLVGRTFVPIAGYGSIYYTPGFNNTGIPNFSENNLFSRNVPVDFNGDGAPDINFADYSLNASGANQIQDLFSDQTRVTAMAFGEYTFEGEMNLTPYFEAIYTERNSKIISDPAQLFPYVPAANPFNICNPGATAVGGVDCGLAYDGTVTDPRFVEPFGLAFEDFCAGFGIPLAGCTPAAFGVLNGPLGAIPTQPIIAVAGDRNEIDTDLSQLRLLGGIRGDLPGFNVGPLSGWYFDASLQYSFSEGTSARSGIREDRLALALGWDPTVAGYSLSDLSSLTELAGGACAVGDVANPELLAADAAAGCTAVNLYAPSLYDPLLGDFASAAERDYVFDNRDFTTEYEQLIFSAYMGGKLFTLPAGDVDAIIGYDYRKEEISSIPDAVANDGLFFGFFTDGGAEGEQVLNEIYGELIVPVLANRPMFQSLNVEAAFRFTDVETTNFDNGSVQNADDLVYSVKAGWRPVDSLLLRATYGTSFRAPSLREVALRSQSGFLGVTDPCIVPVDAFDTLTGDYIPANDTRDAVTIANCQAAGLDPFTLGGGGGNTFSTEVPRGGSSTLESETSTSFTAGFVFEQPWFESFDLTFGFTYFDIEIDNTIIEPGPQFIVNDCFVLEPNLSSTFCDRISRDANGFIDQVDLGFINRDEQTTAGLDINMLVQKEITMWERPVDLALDLRAGRLNEQTTTFVDDSGNVDFDDDVGEFGNTEWTGQASFRADFDNYRVTWQTRYVGDAFQDEDFRDGFSDVFNSTGAGTTQTCAGPSLGDELCRDIEFADEYYVHNASIFYNADNWSIGAGVRNVLDTSPPQIQEGATVVNNTPIGVGYDLQGRTFFVNIQKNFN